MVSAPGRRQQVEYARRRRLSCRRACALLKVARSASSYRSKLPVTTNTRTSRSKRTHRRRADYHPAKLALTRSRCRKVLAPAIYAMAVSVRFAFSLRSEAGGGILPESYRARRLTPAVMDVWSGRLWVGSRRVNVKTCEVAMMGRTSGQKGFGGLFLAAGMSIVWGAGCGTSNQPSTSETSSGGAGGTPGWGGTRGSGGTGGSPSGWSSGGAAGSFSRSTSGRLGRLVRRCIAPYLQ